MNVTQTRRELLRASSGFAAAGLARMTGQSGPAQLAQERAHLLEVVLVLEDLHRHAVPQVAA